MTILLIIAGIIVLTLIVGKINMNSVFKKQVKTLFANSKNISNKIYSVKQLEKLPEPVQKYFNRVLKDGQPYISYARIKHDGQFKSGFDKDWSNIKGEQYATTETPGFIWKGTTLMYTARDLFISDEGRLVVSLLSVFNIADAKGEQYYKGELLRWLGESVLYPTNFLPSEKLQWLPVDAHTAELIFYYKGLSLYYKITFNEMGEMIEMETKRNMEEDIFAPWIIRATNYKQLNNVCVPTNFEVLWRLQEGDFSYAKFNITEVEYNIPEKF
jgi:hypothetical protein